jgi:glycosyltransferase involved in cell wall biosynthesis
VLVVDVPARIVNLDLVSTADIVVVPEELTFFWLKRANLPRHIRLLAGNVVTILPALQHAVAMRSFERRLESRGYVLCRKPPARPLPLQHPDRAILMIGKWRRGGIEQVMLDLANGLTQRGIRITLAVADEEVGNDLSRVAAESGLTAVGFGGSAERLKDFVLREAIDIVNYHHCTLGAETLQSSPATLVYTVHNSYLWFDDAQRRAWREAMRWMDASICVSRQVAAYAERWLGINPARTFVIPNGTELEGAAANRADRLDSSAFAKRDGSFGYLNVATFNRVKVQDRLLRAFALVARENPEAQLTLVGSPADRRFYDEVTELRRSLGLEDRVTLVPGADRGDILEMMRWHDCFVLPSIVEGWSISFLEATMTGLPVVATDVGSARDMAAYSRGVVLVRALGEPLEHMESARLWEVLREPAPEFERSLADAMLAVHRDYAALVDHARNAGPIIQSRFSIDVMVDDTLDCFREVRSRNTMRVAVN